MKDTFLIGRFLPGYHGAYGYRPTGRPDRPAFDREVLRMRLEERAAVLRQRRRRYVVGVQGGLAAAILLVALAFRLPFGAGDPFELPVYEQELVVLEEVTQTRHELPPPPPPRPPVPVEVPDDDLLEDELLDLDASLDLDEVLVALPPPPPPAEPDEDDFEDPIFVMVEDMPELIGGTQALVNAVEYPRVAQMAGMEGSVIVKIVVQADGLPADPVVVRSAGEVLDKAALEAVMKLRFIPGKQRGRPVPVYMTIPVAFRLS